MQHSITRSEAGRAEVLARPAAAVDPRAPLSVVHARALYRPVPPVDYDDDGYPWSDSLPVESMRHHDARTHLVNVVRVRFAEREDVFAAADMGLYFERGNRRALVVPDAMVVFGVRDGPDLSYKLWEQPKIPDLVLEVLSKYTWRKDIYEKPALYAALGVREYWLFDPFGRRRDGGPDLEGWRLDDGRWKPAANAPAGDAFVSDVLGLEVLVRNGELRFRVPGSNDVLPDVVETSKLLEDETARADRTVRADRATVRADRATARADRENARAEAAEQRIADLEARLRRTPGM